MQTLMVQKDKCRQNQKFDNNLFLDHNVHPHEWVILSLYCVFQDNNLTTQPTNTTLPNTSSKTLITTDPLLFPTLEKRSVEIKIKGSYFNILEFLRNIESLKVAILTSDIKLLSITVPDTSVNKSPIQAEISMKLSAYGPRLKVNQE